MPEHVVMKTLVLDHTVFVIIVHKTITMNANSWLITIHSYYYCLYILWTNHSVFELCTSERSFKKSEYIKKPSFC